MLDHPLPDPAAYPWRTTADSAAATRALGARMAGLLQGGEVILLDGALGGGKTCLVQGLGEALGVAEEIVSPTFTLVNTYAGPPRLHHLDFYRVEAGHDLADIGVPDLLDEVLDGAAVLLAEWPHQLRRGLHGVPRLELLVRHGAGPDDRIWHLRGDPEPPAAWQALFGEAARC